MFHNLIFYQKKTSMVAYQQTFMINVMILIYPSSTSLTYVAIYQQHLLTVSQLIRFASTCSTYERFLKQRRCWNKNNKNPD